MRRCGIYDICQIMSVPWLNIERRWYCSYHRLSGEGTVGEFIHKTAEIKISAINYCSWSGEYKWWGSIPYKCLSLMCYAIVLLSLFSLRLLFPSLYFFLSLLSFSSLSLCLSIVCPSLPLYLYLSVSLFVCLFLLPAWLLAGFITCTGAIAPVAEVRVVLQSQRYGLKGARVQEGTAQQQ